MARTDGSSRYLARRVVQAMHANVETNVIASATWGEVVLHRIGDDSLVHLDRVRTTGNVSWVKFEEPWLAACVEGVVRVWHVDKSSTIGRETFQHVIGDPVRAADLSRDGRYLAIGAKRRVILHDLHEDLVVVFEDHTDDICLVRLVGVDQLLITADEDNRVVLRPRTSTRYARSLIDIDVPDEPIPLDLVNDLEDR